MSNNLRPFQWQIGSVVFGRYTQYVVLANQATAYNVNAQDSQTPLSDETTMAQDSFQAQPITLLIGVKDNAPVRHMANTLPEDMTDRAARLLEVLQDEWKANAIKQKWGQYVPLTFCDGYGVVKQIWGRPGKFQYTPKTQRSQWRKVTAEFRRLDTLCYAENETLVNTLVNDADPVVYSTGGRADTWFRTLFYGPMSNPLAIVGDNQIQLGMDIAAGQIVEVNSYPWQRRIIDNSNINWRTKLIGNTKYLDQLQLPKNTALQMSWSADGTTADSKCLVLWRDAYNVV
jgi:hypothetical protein